MARSIGSILVLVAFIGLSKAFNISEFKSISGDIGVFDDWVKLDPMGGHNANEDFGLAFGNDTLYLVSRRNGTAVMGGVVSTLINGTWKHNQFAGPLDEAQYHDQLFTLAGRLFMLTAGENNGRIEFNKLFAWDDKDAKWSAVMLDVPDKNNSFPRLDRGPSRFISIDVPIQDGKVAYVVATDHEMNRNDSSTSFSSLEVAFDQMTGKPLNASLKFINRINSDLGKAVIASAQKDGLLYAVVATFTADPSNAKISVDYAIDLSNNNTKVDGIKLDGASIPVLDFTIGGRIFQAKNMLLFVSPRGPAATSLVWDLDLVGLKMQDASAKLPDFNRVFVMDQKTMRLLTADLKKGAFAAKISA